MTGETKPAKPPGLSGLRARRTPFASKPGCSPARLPGTRGIAWQAKPVPLVGRSRAR